MQTRSGTLIDFLDELDPTLIKHVVHRSMLSRQKAGSLSIFMQVWQLLDVSENLEAGELVKGALVTVGGEKAGQKRAPGAFWNQDCLEKRARRGR